MFPLQNISCIDFQEKLFGNMFWTVRLTQKYGGSLIGFQFMEYKD